MQSLQQELPLPSDRKIVLTPPISEDQIRSLSVGDVVVINGVIHTGRDEVHKYLLTHPAPTDLAGGVLYHCGPVALQDENGKWYITAAGPTTSMREEPYQAEIIQKSGIRAIVGKGGMGPKTAKALQEFGAVYLNAIGGAAQYYAECIQEVLGVDLLEFGIPEAMWHLRVRDFVAVVTMDANGKSLHQDIAELSLERLSKHACSVKGF
jgi:fumarate hydratase class I